MKSEETSSKCLASTGGCHCSKRRKQRIKQIIQVPALSTRLADIPADDRSWRKYGQKPIKGSPHPRSIFNHLIRLYVIVIVVATGSYGCLQLLDAFEIWILELSSSASKPRLSFPEYFQFSRKISIGRRLYTIELIMHEQTQFLDK